MSDPSKAQIDREIAAKKQKLEELKRLRAQRLQQQSVDEGSNARMAAMAAQTQQGQSVAPAGPAQSAEDILSSVSSLIAVPAAAAPAASPKTPAAAPSPAAAGKAAPGGSGRSSPKLAASAPTHVDIVASDSKILYEQATQTDLKRKQAEAEAAAAVAGSAAGSASTGTSTAAVWDSIDADERDEIILERDELRAREVGLLNRIRELSLQGEARAAAAEAAAEQALHAELPPGEAEKVLASAEFNTFLDRSSKIMERLLGYESARGSGGANGMGLMSSALGSFDYMSDYSAPDEASDGKNGSGGRGEQKLTASLVFANDAASGSTAFARTTNRPVTAIDWSPKYPELLLAAYAADTPSEDGGVGTGASGTDGLSMEPDGSVLVWNLHMSKRPEYTFTCQSGIHTALFHPAHPKLLVGGCENGQLVIWDMRTSKHTPVNRSSLSHGHTQPVFALDIQPLASGVYQIVSASSDGQVCVWTENNLHKPLHDVQLVNMRSASNLGATDGSSVASGTKEDLTTTCFSLPARDTNTLLLGSDEGRIYKARLHEAVASERIYDVIPAHDAPMTGLHFHPNFKSTAGGNSGTSVNDLFLTSSFDWTVKLWSARLSKPLFVFESARDYVHACGWCPSSPYVFAAGDGTGRLDVWNLAGGGEEAGSGGDDDVPAVSVQVGAGVGGEVEATSGTQTNAEGADPAANPLSTLRPNHAITALKWNHTGSAIACGLSNGALHLYDVSPDLSTPSREGTQRFYDKIAQRIATGASR